MFDFSVLVLRASTEQELAPRRLYIFSSQWYNGACYRDHLLLDFGYTAAESCSPEDIPIISTMCQGIDMSATEVLLLLLLIISPTV